MIASDGKVVVYAPYAKDSASIVGLLRGEHFDTDTASSLADLVGHFGESLGAVLMSEEALVQADWSALLKAVHNQPTWSSYPFILLISQKRSAVQTEAVYRLFPPEVANVMVLERPMSSTALLSAVRWALAGRRRQFVTKSHLDELERRAQQQRLLTRELAHRVKNTIAMLQSIVGQTMRPHPEMADVQEQIVERFSALARTHDLLFSTDFQEAEFGELVRQTLSVHSRNFVIKGPAIHFSPQAALSFALVIHELATNSIKYGALSSDQSGQVDVMWEIQPGPNGDQLKFDWRESGGPPVSAPARKGFGSRLIRATLGGLGQSEISYAEEGFRLAFTGDLAGLAQSVTPTD